MTTLFYYLDQFWFDIQDPRTKDLPLVDIRFSTFAFLMASYVIFTTKIGPRLMSNQKPFELRQLMLAYNLIMVCINFFFFVQAIVHSNFGLKIFDAKYPDRSDRSPYAMYLIQLGFYYWMSKFADLFDTLFFVLRKKNNHISFLHVYHHTMVPSVGWLMMKLNPIMPGVYLFVAVNAMVHTMMYAYYGLSALGPEVKKYLWWKKYLTQLQLVQFAVFGCYMLGLGFVHIGYPPILFWAFFSQPPFFFYMFYDFYKSSYTRDEEAKKKLAAKTN